MTAKKHIISIVLIIFVMLAGLSGPTYFYLTTRADSTQIQLPGTPINNTKFATLINESLDRAVFVGSFQVESSKPYVLRFIPQSGELITQEVAINISLQFIPSNYRNYLNFTHWAELNPNLPEWTIRFTSHRNDTGDYYGLVIITKLNAINGRITNYHVHWDEYVDPSILLPPIEPDSSPINYSIAEDKLIQFLSENSFSVPITTRLLEVNMWPNETDTSWYRFKFGIPTGNVTPDEALQGLEARIDAVTGEVLDFTYSNIEIPLVSEEDVIDPNFVLNQIMENYTSDLNIVDADYIGSFLRFRLIETTYDPIRVQLVWTFQFKDDEDGFYEIHRDAYNGGVPIPNRNVLYGLTEESSRVIFVIPIFAGITSLIIFLVFRRYIRRTI